MNTIKLLTIFALLLLLSIGCSDTKPFLRKPAPDDPVQIGDPELRPNGDSVLTFYALGDWGTGEKEQKAVAEALKANVSKIPPGRELRPFVLGLGDNVYEIGLPEGWNNPKAIELLEETFGEIYSDVKYEGEELVFHIVPGNHDYAGRARGNKVWGDVIHQETTAEALYSYWKYYPIDPAKNADTNDSTDYHALKSEDIFALTVPEKVEFQNHGLLSVFAIDTQVLLEIYEKENDQLLEKHWQTLGLLLGDDTTWKMIIGHHPIRSHGFHGGFRTAIWWVPPITLFTIVDKLFLKRLQDLDNPHNRAFQNDLIEIMKEHEVDFYLAGHEHNLQFIEADGRNFQIVSGSAGKLSAVTHDSDTYFSHSAYGFVRFDILEDEMWIEFFQVDPETKAFNSTALLKVSK